MKRFVGNEIESEIEIEMGDRTCSRVFPINKEME